MVFLRHRDFPQPLSHSRNQRGSLSVKRQAKKRLSLRIRPDLMLMLEVLSEVHGKSLNATVEAILDLFRGSQLYQVEIKKLKYLAYENDLAEKQLRRQIPKMPNIKS